MPSLRDRSALIALLGLALAGCAGNGKGLDENGHLIGTGSSGGPLTATFDSIQENIFTPICTKCHIGASAPEGLQLDEQHSYALIVGVPSAEQMGLLRINPGNPDQSYLIRKVQGGPDISGAQMPFGGPYLPQSTIDVIRQWVMAGATKTAAASSTAPTARAEVFRVAATAPDRDSIVSMVLPNIVVAFNSIVDANLVDNTVVTLERMSSTQASDGTATPDISAIPVITRLPTGNSSALLITPRTPLPSGVYRVTLRGTLADLNARALGSDYSFMFTVDAIP